MKKSVKGILMQSQDYKTIWSISQTFILKSAKNIGDTRDVLQVGIALVNMQNKIRVICLNRRIIQTRIE
ncbi:hypothetical protein BBI01_01305 [Chryseobacterium artocarpi]|uniref:Uncharacterized protein n=1 Tax=Chryseobacterium artocarpi TaxID=1414727 RepID=A0A1B8ZZU6_9FLAO|nr:hypothetical protein BBI01_01305 [Chryseobacterium artocarpi]